MKKVLFINIILSLFFVTNYIIAQTVPTIPAKTPDPESGCTGFETTAYCHPEWTLAMSNCVPGSFSANDSTCVTINPDLLKIMPKVSVCSPTNTAGPCRPERVNPYAAGTIAKQAENMGEQLGYTISCEASKTSLGFGLDGNTNLDYFMNSLCTINGQSGFSAELLVSSPSNWTVLATELKSLEASKVCGIYKVVYWNPDGSYKCINSPAYTDTCVGAENALKFNYVTKQPCTPVTTPTTPTVPTTPAVTPSSQTGISSNTSSYIKNLYSVLNNMIANLKNQLGMVQTGQAAPQTTASYVSSVSQTLNGIISNLKGQLNSIDTEQTTTGIITVQTGASAPLVELTLGNGLKSGTYSVGDTINYQVKMQNVDLVSSYYNTIPKDTCVGGSISGEQKPWVIKTVSSLSNFNAKVEQCQAGSTYVITVVGTNKTSGQIVASSVSVYIKNQEVSY